MRIQKRNEVVFYYANPLRHDHIRNADGLMTGEKQIVYSDPVCKKGNISPATGSVSIEYFGTVEAYDKVIALCEPDVDINMTSVFWIDMMPDGSPGLQPVDDLHPADTVFPADQVTRSYDYIVGRISRSLNTVLIAVKKVDTR